MAKQAETMFAQMRKKAMLELLSARGFITVSELCAQFSVSPATVRNDLHELERAGLLERTHGGAISAQKAAYEPNTYQKQDQRVEEKIDIAQAALRHIHIGDVIALDTGTTTFQLAKLLGAFEKLTVVTYDLQIAAWLEGNTDVSIVMVGGQVRRHFHCTAGQTAIDSLANLHVDKAFMAVNGVTAEMGLTTPSLEMASVKRALSGGAKQRCLLCDASKIGHCAFVGFERLDRIHTLITGKTADPAFCEAARALGVEVELA